MSEKEIADIAVQIYFKNNISAREAIELAKSICRKEKQYEH